MNRHFTYLFLLFLISVMAHGQSTKEVTLTYSANDFSVSVVDGKTYITSAVHQLYFLSDSLAPALPYIGVKVLVGPNSNYGNFSHSETEQLFASNVVMAPNPIEVPTSAPMQLDEGTEVVFSNPVYPEEQVIYSGTHKMDGYCYLSFLICPFRYDVEHQQLFINTSCTLTINYSTPAKAPGVNVGNTAGSVMRETVRSLVYNPEEMDELYVSPDSSLTGGYKYLIITKDSLKPAFQKLADWKTQKGIKAKVLTIEEIDNTYTGSTQRLRIKKALKDYYDESYCGLKYALLGGGTPIVPAQYCKVVNSNLIESTPADLFYACFDTMDWDSCEKGDSGELDFDIDIDPEIIVTRLPAEKVTDAETMVNRIIEYEKNPKTEHWEDKILMTGAMLKNYYTTGNDIVSDAQYACDSIYNYHIAPYWSGQCVRFYDTDTDFSGRGNYELNQDNLQAELEKGYHFVYMNTHGIYGSWKVESGYYSDADSLHNSSLTIFITSACYTNAFDISSTISLSKKFMKNPYSGALAYFGSSRYGWVNTEVNRIGASNDYNIALLNNLFLSDDHGFGSAAQQAKISSIGISKISNNPKRWLQFSINPLCDPEMPVYLSKPKKYNSLYISTYVHNNKDLIRVTNGRCRITVMSKEDNGATFYEVRNNVKSATFDHIPSGCSVCITKPGYIPYIFDYHRKVILQNERWNHDKEIIADSVLIGSDVTDTIDHGLVVIEGGKTSISGNNVTIQNGFEIKLGAELEIQ